MQITSKIKNSKLYWQDFGIRRKLIFAISLPICFFAIATITTQFEIKRIAKISGKLKNRAAPHALLSAKLRNGIDESQSTLLFYLISQKSSYKKARQVSWQKQILPNLERLQTKHRTLSNSESLKQLAKLLQRLRDYQDEIELLADESGTLQNRNKRINSEINSKLVPLLFETKGLLHDFFLEAEAQMDSLVAEGDTLAEEATFTNKILFIGGLILCFLYASFITKGTTRKLDDETSKLDDSSRSLQRVSTKLFSMAAQQTSSTNALLNSSEELALTAKEVAQLGGAVAEQTKNSMESCQIGRRSCETLEDAMSSLKKHVEQTADKINNVKEHSSEIELATEIMKELAEQTTILSYNASIEAAAAGEHGRSFDVVARQVGNLARRAKDASLQVHLIIQKMQEAVKMSVNGTAEALQVIDDGFQAQGKTSKQMLEIISQMKRMLESVDRIQIANRQQQNAAEFLKEEIESIRLATEHTQDESKELVTTAETVKTNSENLKRI